MASPKPASVSPRLHVMLLLVPWYYILLSLYHMALTLVRVGLRAPSALLDLPGLRAASFASLWKSIGPDVWKIGAPAVVPLLAGRVQAGIIRPEPVGPPLAGTVVEIGSGPGLWAETLSTMCVPETETGVGAEPTLHRRGARSGGITRVVAVEPSHDSRVALHRRVAELGLQSIYQVFAGGVQDLLTPEFPVAPGSVDCVITIMTLCSVPDPQQVVRQLYALLRKGGRLYVYEHVGVREDWQMMHTYQAFINTFWPSAIGGCNLARSTEKWLREAGPWADIDLTRMVGEPWSQCTPHIIGTLTK